MSSPRPSAVVVLAAGEGTRMVSTTPKVLHEIAGRSLLGHVLAAVAGLDPEHLVVVVGHGRERVTEHLASIAPSAVAVVQEQQNGTGHAVRVALEGLEATGVALDGSGPVLVVAGDTPLLTTATLQSLVDTHAAAGASSTVLTAVLDDPTGYGRVLRDGDSVTAIVEHKDADDSQRAVREVNSGVYAFDAAALRDALGRLTTDNVQGEEYLTDVLGLHVASGLVVAAVTADDANETLGVNDRVQLAEARALLRDRTNTGWMRAGVTIVDPATTWIDSDVVLAPDCVVERNTGLHGRTTIARGAVVGPDTTLIDVVVGEGASVLRSQVTSADIGAGATVGPFTFVRPGTVLGPKAKLGAYVEAKNAVIGEGSKVPHLSYVGDAEIGVGSNLGAGTITVNYDGIDKHRTVIGDHVRVGSDSMLIAPVTVGDGAYTAAGSVVTDAVPPGAMAVARARQRNIEGWVERRRPGSPAAEAAAAAKAHHASGTATADPGDSTHEEQAQ
ncbi:bifunctional UDP-N-acetylglucosamine diphosphorylase/glucosamine-1-phosphate N-acetyltransferase GlmU [Longivirga aurantiaca]|uniref:Bifunctional protein GlmU n=1 Tax=Longivirga aurantiaca TaxID=1837743 RepID=A0ABW1SXL6_9ACTN